MAWRRVTITIMAFQKSVGTCMHMLLGVYRQARVGHYACTQPVIEP
jgi:hypothetical protein